MAALLGEQVGETVGYRVRSDTRIGPNTRIEIITEGVLTRLLQEDPSLENVGIVIFDEFHERSLHADLGLALCLESREVLREDLKIMVMSATLEAEPVAKLLGDAAIVTSEGRSFAVETRYLNRRVEGRIEPAVVRAIMNALENDTGDILVFLPGAGEIKRVEARLMELNLGPGVRVFPLHGSLTHEAQDRAVAPATSGIRKIVLATSIAETSLTVEGVRIVIDSGLMRIPRFSPRTGMTRLETVPVSRASADQRRGRAGRLGPGICYRLWNEQDERNFASNNVPEILEADLTPLALELAVWGETDPAKLRWLNPPPSAAYNQARELLGQLGAIDKSGSITMHGRRMAELGVHPRLAHMMLSAIPLRLGGLACELAAVLSERDIFRADTHIPNADVRLRIEALRQAETFPQSELITADGYAIDAVSCRRALAEALKWKQMLKVRAEETGDVDHCGLLLAFAYPDRIAQFRSAGRFLMSNGRGAKFSEMQPLANSPYLVAAELDDQGAESRIFLAAPVDLADLEVHCSDLIRTESVIYWDRAAQTVQARKHARLGALMLKDVPLANPDLEKMTAALLHGIRTEGLDILPWTKAARQLMQRIAFMNRLDPQWAEISEETLMAALEDWLAPHIYGMKSRDDLQRLKLAEILEMMLSWDQRRMLDECAPTHIFVPSGSRLPVDYSDPASPVLAVRLQEMFGLVNTPLIGCGKIPLTLHLLSPAHRPVQVTRDLASFWKTAYFEIKKDLKGRYPKHYWPDDPLAAPPTNRTRPRL
jgi:ATP-dependent helicase HrpB